jgi:inorganic pyrophosphatase
MANNNDFLVRIEISKGTCIKYEFDHKTNNLLCDRILHTPMMYIFNYGYIENTMGGDGDPIDAVVICDYPLFPTCLIKCRAIGLLETEDNEGIDEKVIFVPISKVEPTYNNINDISDLDKTVLEKIKFFFENYKKLEKDKWVKVKEWKNSEYTINFIKNNTGN